MLGWQHRFVILSGILGATASAIAKLALGTGEDALIHQWFTGVCEAHILPSNGQELDQWMLSHVHRLIGHIMIKHRIVLLHKWKYCMSIVENAACRLRIFEVDWCSALELIPRISCIVLVILCNVWMVALFVKGLVLSGSVAGTTLASASNFAFSALLGAVIWQERFSDTWWVGFVSVIIGVLILSTVQPEDDEDSGASSQRGFVPGTATTTTTTATTTNSSKSFFPKTIRVKAPPLPPTTAGKPQRQTVFKQRTLKTTKLSFFNRTPTPRTNLVDRSFCNECPLCEGQLFDEATGESPMAIADMSPNCFHLTHGKCLKQSGSAPAATSRTDGLRSTAGKAGCPVCSKSISMWISAKQAAHFAAFWMNRVEACLQALGPVTADDGTTKPRPAQDIRDLLQKDATLTKEQKRYIGDDPTGLGKGLASALEWGGCVDYNGCNTGQIGWSKHLRSQGIWSFDSKKDDLWFWEWGKAHPRQRCEGCQFLNRSLPIACTGCQGSCEAAYYCSERCQKRDWQRHKMICQEWQQYGPNANK